MSICKIQFYGEASDEHIIQSISNLARQHRCHGSLQNGHNNLSNIVRQDQGKVPTIFVINKGPVAPSERILKPDFISAAKTLLERKGLQLISGENRRPSIGPPLVEMIISPISSNDPTPSGG